MFVSTTHLVHSPDIDGKPESRVLKVLIFRSLDRGCEGVRLGGKGGMVMGWEEGTTFVVIQ